ncbi:MAG: ABC transporter permease [Clostridia bacterium]|nr:ABC transporter permease [Clostridia bacterium]
MRIILKYTLKNIIKKPFRTLLVMFCVTVCTIAALLTFDMTDSLTSLLKNFVGDAIGTMDICVETTNCDPDCINIDGFPENTSLVLYGIQNSFTRDIEGEYTFIHEDYLNIFSCDIQNAYDMSIIPYNEAPADGEIIISKDFAEDYGYVEGDTIVLHDINKAPHDFKVAQVYDYGSKVLFATTSGVVNLTDMEMLCNGELEVNELVIDIKDDNETKTARDMILNSHPEYTVMTTMEDTGLNELVNQMRKLFLLLFAICFLMVIFVSISISERIVSERMAVIGTFRSLGLSVKFTSLILLIENAIYGLVGSAVGCLIYNAIRSIVLSSMLVTSVENPTFRCDPVNPFMFIFIIIGAIIVECLCPIKEIIRTMKMAVRDIIFANKDTEYKLNKITTIIGISCIAVAAILFICPKTFITSIITFALLTIAVTMLFPYALKFIGGLIGKLGEKTNKPILQLASTETYTKKSTVGATVLIATASTLAIVIYTFATSLASFIDTDTYSSSVIVNAGIKESYYYSYIDNLESVKATEMIYIAGEKINFSDYLDKENTDYSSLSPDEKKDYDAKYSIDVAFIGIDDDGYQYFTGIPDAPTLASNEVALGEVLANKLGLSEGDSITFTTNELEYYPLEQTYTVKKICNTNKFSSAGSVIVMNQDLLISLYGDYPTVILVDAEDPVKVDSLIERYAADTITKCYTREEFIQENKDSSASLIGIIYAIIIFGVGLTFIGSVSNLLIGFDGRKREFAVLVSTSMSRKKASKMLLLESLISTGIALIIAIPFSLIMIKPVITACSEIAINMDITTTPGTYIGFVVVLWIVFTLTSFFPRKALRKMKLAEQLKYE